MLLAPTTDLKEGRYVRLKQGLVEQTAVFPNSLAETALHQLKQDACRLHLADLNGTFVGIPRNFPAVKPILAEVVNNIPVQLGDSIRDLTTIEKYLDLGLADVIIGTAAVKNPDFMHETCKEFPGWIIVGLGAKDDMVAIDDRATVTEHRIADLTKRLEEDGVNAIIYTDIGRDGMMSGTGIKATVKFAQTAAVPVITPDSLTNLDDIHVLCAVEKHSVAGATTDRAICEGNIDFIEAQKLADALSAA